MPYHIVYRKGQKRPYKIVKTSTNKVVGTSLTKTNAAKSIVARQIRGR